MARHLASQSKQNCLGLKEPCFTHLLRNKRLELSCTSCNESVRRLCLPCPSPFAFARPSLLGRCIWQADTAASQPASQPASGPAGSSTSQNLLRAKVWRCCVFLLLPSLSTLAVQAMFPSYLSSSQASNKTRMSQDTYKDKEIFSFPKVLPEWLFRHRLL